ncbi:MAG: 3-methyl-2-oxobutanoate dehydrogenase subunit VorB [Treponema sp.]|jgi:2-oxoglutarate ferredoxin oxidoreductase subunit alpha|nr:3-methyl-2-oxobutanoate dehydrogenase subunit VorB [Treponema sp.]
MSEGGKAESRADDRVLMKGNEAIAEAALRAGCRAYFGYPITPQGEIIAYMANRLIDAGGVFIQAESEIASINMVYGASAAGARAMTSSSSPGISLKQEGISYAAGADLPVVVVNVSRGGPGLGSIAPAQSDYFQATRGGGHGDYRCIVLAPKSVQECADLCYLAFDLADKYRMPVMVLADGVIGQSMEGVLLPPPVDAASLPGRDWIVGHMAGEKRPPRHISSLGLVPEEMEARTRARFERYEIIKAEETRFEASGYRIPCGSFTGEGADITLAAYGTSARVALGAQQLAAKEGIRVGIFRPITLWPFPYRALSKIAATGKPILVVEMSLGQFVEDVKLAAFEAGPGSPRPPIHLLGHSGGMIPSEEEVFAEIVRILRKQGAGEK